jgi:glycosyltransferase involved in cell wall biosynthesis
MNLELSSKCEMAGRGNHSQLRLGVVRDFRAEKWPSMDLCADQLLANLTSVQNVISTDLETPFQCRFQRLPVLGRKNAAFNADRLVNRHLILPQYLKRHSTNFDFVHIIDHSYAHLVTAMPPGRTGVYCHDLDAFRSIVEPGKDSRPWWFRSLAKRTLRGLRKAAVVFYSTREVRQQLIDARLVPAEKLVHAPYGVAAEFTPDAPLPMSLPDPGLPAGRFLLHVGSHSPRKRIDVLLDVFAAVRERCPGVKLVQVGPLWNRGYIEQIGRLGIEREVLQFSGLKRDQLAELYRRAAVVLVTSESEGFGLPVIESLACGAIVIASDLPVLREVGGHAVIYRPIANIPVWVDAVTHTLSDRGFAPPRELRLSQAARYTWKEHARIIGEAYLGLMNKVCVTH